MTYVWRRFLQMIPVIIIAGAVVFLMMRLIPGDPALLVAGPDATPDQIAAVRQQLGLNHSVPVQFVYWVRQLMTGSLGVSFQSKFPVVQLVRLAFKSTLQLAVAALLLAVLIGIPLGVMAARRKGNWVDVLVTAFGSVGLGLPNFWFGLLLIILFALTLHWLPPSGWVDVFRRPGPGLKFLILPAITLSLNTLAQLSRFTRAALLDVLHQQYIRTARAKGLPERVVVYRHALRNALVPVITIMGIQLTRLLGGAVVVESVFGFPGLGRLILRAIGGRDYPVVQAVLLVFVGTSLLVNLGTDLLQGFLDPRARPVGQDR